MQAHHRGSQESRFEEDLMATKKDPRFAEGAKVERTFDGYQTSPGPSLTPEERAAKMRQDVVWNAKNGSGLTRLSRYTRLWRT